MCGWNFKTGQKEEIKVAPPKAESQGENASGAGKGRKQCGGCKEFVGVRTQNCVCGWNFQTGQKEEPKAVVVKQQETYTEGGRGKKHCPCGVYVGARLPVCPACGHKFEMSNKAERATLGTGPNIPENPNIAAKKSLVLTPTVITTKSTGFVPNVLTLILHVAAGACPVKLTGSDYDSVSDWATQVRHSFELKNQFLKVEGLVYWVNRFYDHYSNEYREVINNLKQIYASEFANKG